MMIKFENVSKTYHIRKFEKHVLNDVYFTLQKGESIGICGANGAEKSTLLRLMSGVEQPTSGRVTKTMSTSWPLGYGSAFQTSHSAGMQARLTFGVSLRSHSNAISSMKSPPPATNGSGRARRRSC